MSLLGSLYTGVSGLNASQNSLNTTAHNIANAGTRGYVRQNVVHTDSQYIKWGMNRHNTLQYGMGVDIAAVNQIRDVFLDRYYRAEIGRQGFYETQRNTVWEIESMFGEMEGVTFQKDMESFWESLQELSKEPDSIVTRATVVGTAFTFIERAENIAKQLREYQINLNTQITEEVNKINSIAKQIYALNEQINYYESNGIENANDLRDERNNLLDDLGKIIHITYKELPNGKVNVFAETAPLVMEDGVNRMAVEPINEASSMLKPVWPFLDNADVLQLDRVPSTALDTDIGTLKGLILSRGSKEATYRDIPIKPGDGATSAEIAEYERKVKEYNNLTGASVIMTVQAQFDQLIHGLVTRINDLLCPNKTQDFGTGQTVTFEDGTTGILSGSFEVLDQENAPKGMDENHTMGEALFNRKGMERYTKVSYYDAADNTTKTVYLYNKEGHKMTTSPAVDGSGDPILDGSGNPVVNISYEEDNLTQYSLFTIGEIEINEKIMNNYSLLPLSSNSGTDGVDRKTAEALVSIWGEKFASVSPNTSVVNTFKDYYISFIDELAMRGEKYEKMSEHQEAMVGSIDNERQRVMGVSTEEELVNLIKFQHAYNASARYITVVDRMLEHLISRLG